jgi:toxin ParE1/3/4
VARVLPVVPRAQALRDVDEAIDHYLAEAGTAVALGFVEAIAAAYTHIGRFPGTGSPRLAHELNLPGLRCWRLNGYPQRVFYVERPDHVDVWRVLHGARDMAAWLHEPTPDPG